jgi:opacity protein-like surface antigen
VTRVETTEKAGISSDGENYTDISLGIGADMRVANNVFVSLEYLRAIDRSGDEISNLSLGFGGRF